MRLWKLGYQQETEREKAKVKGENLIKILFRHV
jgi:hypothetical protein